MPSDQPSKSILKRNATTIFCKWTTPTVRNIYHRKYSNVLLEKSNFHSNPCWRVTSTRLNTKTLNSLLIRLRNKRTRPKRARDNIIRLRNVGTNGPVRFYTSCTTFSIRKTKQCTQQQFTTGAARICDSEKCDKRSQTHTHTCVRQWSLRHDSKCLPVVRKT